MSESSRGGRGTKKIVAPRGRGRRTAAEREQILRRDQELTRERDQEFAKSQQEARIQEQREKRERDRRAQAAAARGRGRGRGGFFGDAGVKHELSSGPLSGGSAISSSIGQGKAFPRPWAPSNRSGAGRAVGTVTIADSTGGHGGGGGGGGGGRSAGKSKAPEFEYHSGESNDEAEDGGYISSDLEEDDAGPRIDITMMKEIIEISDDEDGERNPFMGPVQVIRKDHVERDTKGQDVDDDDGKVKKEGDEDTEMGNAPDSKAKSKARDKSVELISERPFQGAWRPAPLEIKEEPMADDPPARVRSQTKEATEGAADGASESRKARPAKPDEKVKLHPEEEKENARLAADAEAMIREFGDTTRYNGADNTFLFQFPPILPNLVEQKPITIKDDPDAPPPLPTAATNGTSTATSSVPIKVEDDASTDPLKPNPTTDNSVRPAHLPTFAPGSIGKLRVHKSGKVTMDWGGTPLIVQNAVETKFLQNLVMLRIEDEVPGQVSGSMRGQATSFGQPKGRFVVGPDWDTMLPDPDEKEKTRKIKTET